jgi:ribosomal protein L7Ae-like RNA K-turn-binding protein
MKNSWVYFIALLITSCTSPVVFDGAYPENEPPLSAIPDFFQGVFMCESDSTIITIDEQYVLALDVNSFEESVQKINEREACTLIGNEIYFDEIQECVPIEYIGEDSVKGQYITMDTLFHLGPKSIAKMYKGSVVLSQEVDKEEWILSILSLDAYNNIYYRAINENSELDALADITEMKQIGVDRNSEPIYKVKPTKKEFDEIFDNQEIFLVCEYLMRVNLEEFPLYIF